MAAPDGADVDDTTLVRFQHIRQHNLDGIEAAPEIDGKHPVPGFRQIGHLQLPGDQALFRLEADRRPGRRRPEPENVGSAQDGLKSARSRFREEFFVVSGNDTESESRVILQITRSRSLRDLFKRGPFRVVPLG